MTRLTSLHTRVDPAEYDREVGKQDVERFQIHDIQRTVQASIYPLP